MNEVKAGLEFCLLRALEKYKYPYHRSQFLKNLYAALSMNHTVVDPLHSYNCIDQTWTNMTG